MENIYLDNAATTPIHPQVIEVMTDSMKHYYGNPSSTHKQGRSAKVIIETARKSIAKQFKANAKEIIFTSGGTEANNFVLLNAVENLKVTRIITTSIEHSSVLNTVKFLKEKFSIEVIYLPLNEFGEFNFSELESALADSEAHTLVSLMMINNEIGNVLSVAKVASLCEKYDALFHSDTVQAIGLYAIDLGAVKIDFMTASAHKFHGPKGVGFLYVRKGIMVKSIYKGGLQEKLLIPGTENVHAILGMQKAFEIAYADISEKHKRVKNIKKNFYEKLTKEVKGVAFNGMSSNLDESSPAILNVRFPIGDDFFLLNLDIAGVFVSAGSACQSGVVKTSHVLKSILKEEELTKISLRISFSVFTTEKEIDSSIRIIKNLLLLKEK